MKQITGKHDLTQGSIAKGVVLFSLPLLGSSIVQQLYATVDLLFVGNALGSNAVGAVGISTLLISCLIGFFVGLSIGVNVVVARFFGQGLAYDVKRAIHTSVLLGLVGGVGLMVLGVLVAPSYLSVMATPSEIFNDALSYLNIYFLSMVSVVLFNQSAGVFRGIGDSWTPLLAQIIGGLCNIVMNALFLYVLHLGIVGSALATLVSQSVAAGIVLFKLFKHSAFPLRLGELRFYGDVVKGILLIGVPAGLQSLVITISNIFIQHRIDLLGTAAIAAFSAYFKIELPIYYAIVSLGQAATTYVAQNHAAGFEVRARKATNVCLVLGIVVSAILAAVLVGAGHPVFWLFLHDAAATDIGVSIISITFPCYWIYVFLEVLGASVRGRGNSIAPMIIILSNICVLRTIVLFAISAQGATAQDIAWLYPLTWITTSICMAVCYRVVIGKKGRTAASQSASLQVH